MYFFPLVSVTFIYFLVAILKPTLQPKSPVNICSVCVAVSLTWLILLVMWLAGYTVSVLSLAVLMGMSVTGIMYKSEALYQHLKIKNFWFVRLVIILGGFYVVFSLLTSEWFTLTFIAILSFFLIVLATFLFQGITHADALKKAKGKKSLIQKLEDCC